MDKPMILLSPTAILGYGFPESSFSRGLSLNPDLIAVDAGSTDPGPYYLGSGNSFVPRGAVKRDLTYLLRAALSRRIPSSSAPPAAPGRSHTSPGAARSF